MFRESGEIFHGFFSSFSGKHRQKTLGKKNLKQQLQKGFCLIVIFFSIDHTKSTNLVKDEKTFTQATTPFCEKMKKNIALFLSLKVFAKKNLIENHQTK